MCQKLFKDVQLSPGDRRTDETFYDFICRSARCDWVRWRKELERWFSRYPCVAQSELRGRVDCCYEGNTRGALFELCMHEMLLSLGCQVDLHSCINGLAGHPDFLVTDRNGQRFFAEAIVVTGETRESFAQRNAVNKVRDTIRKLRIEHFCLIMSVDAPFTRCVIDVDSPQTIAVCLSSIDPHDVAQVYGSGELDKLPAFRLKVDKATVVCYPWPKADSNECGTVCGTISTPVLVQGPSIRG